MENPANDKQLSRTDLSQCCSAICYYYPVKNKYSINLTCFSLGGFTDYPTSNCVLFQICHFQKRQKKLWINLWIIFPTNKLTHRHRNQWRTHLHVVRRVCPCNSQTELVRQTCPLISPTYTASETNVSTHLTYKHSQWDKPVQSCRWWRY